MKYKNLFLIVPLTLATAFSLSSCSDSMKFIDTNAAKNIRLENRVLKWDQKFGIEDPYTVVKVCGQEHLVYARTSLDLTNIVSTTESKLDIEIISKPNYFYWMYKDVTQKVSFDIKTERIPAINTSVDNGGQEIVIRNNSAIDVGGNEDDFELVLNGVSQKVKGFFSIPKAFSEFDNGVSIKCRRLAKDESTFHSPWIDKFIYRLETPKNLTLNGQVLTWECSNFTNNYFLYINDKFEQMVNGNSYEIPFGIEKGSKITVKSHPGYYLTEAIMESKLSEPYII